MIHAGLELQDWLDVGVAGGTLLLAVATFWLAKGTSAQSEATVELARVARRQLEATTEPKLRLSRIQDAKTADLYFADGMEALIVSLQNVGAGLAELEDVSLTLLIGPDGGGGTVTASFGTREPEEDLSDPTLSPGEDWLIAFRLGADDLEVWKPSSTIEVRAMTRAVGSGQRYYLSTRVQHDEASDRWRVTYERFNPTEAKMLG